MDNKQMSEDAIFDCLRTVQEVAGFFHELHHKVSGKVVEKEYSVTEIAARYKIKAPPLLHDASVKQIEHHKKKASQELIITFPVRGEVKKPSVAAVRLICWRVKIGRRIIFICIECWDYILCGVTIYF